MYDEIRQNLIDNFFNKHYRYSRVSLRKAVFEDMKQRLPFPFTFNDSCTSMQVILGNGISFIFNIHWEEKIYKNTMGREMRSHRLISID